MVTEPSSSLVYRNKNPSATKGINNMPISNSTAFRNTLAQAFETAVGAGGRITYYSGTVPTNADAALSGNTVIAQAFVPSADFMGNPVGGVAALSATLTDLAADNSGTMTFFRWETSAGAAVQQGTVTVTGGGGDITFASVAITAGQTINLTSFNETGS
jgi:hypothetical protein